MTKTYLILFAVTAAVAILLTAGCCCAPNLSYMVDQKVVHDQVVKGTFQGQISWVFNDCIVVLSDHSQYRLWNENYNTRTVMCNSIPFNEPLELTLTKYSDSQGRYDITAWRYEPCQINVTTSGNSFPFSIPDTCKGDVNVMVVVNST